MIKIIIPNNNIQERKYIIEILFNEFLDLDHEVTVDSKIDNWNIELENGNKLIIKDAFFNKYPNNLEYLKKENIPIKVEFSKNDFIVEDDIPIVYGNNEVMVKSDSDRKIIECEIDIFASSFFMLTRWEEYVNKARDNHERFPATESLAYKNNFLDRPIVNEYVEMFWNMLNFLEYNKKRKKYLFRIYPTHDIDHIYAWNKLSDLLYTLFRDLKRKFLIIYIFKTLKKYYLYKIGKMKDPYDTFELIMNLSEKYDLKSYFFFMGEGVTKYDNSYSSKDLNLVNNINKIKKRGHYIGIHPTYNAFNNKKQLSQEKNELEKNFNTKIEFGREHYLRFEVPLTWQIWEDNNMKWDSTMNYSGYDGFRCGVCYEYSVFNILTQKKLNLREKPLILMDANSIDKLTNSQMKDNVLYLIKKVKKYNGDFIFLWHNSSFNSLKWNKFDDIFEYILSFNKDK